MESIRFKLIIGALILSLAPLSMPAHAEILNVPDDFETIQEAIDEAGDGDTVLVAPGEYV